MNQVAREVLHFIAVWGRIGERDNSDFVTPASNAALSRTEGFVQYFHETGLKTPCSFLTC